MSRSYYSNRIEEFLQESSQQILGILCQHHSFQVEELQKNAWLEQIAILKRTLQEINSAHIIFEYSIPRMGKRLDNVLLYKGIIFAIEFKVGDRKYTSQACDQVIDYATDLKNFHEQSLNHLIIPVLVATEAESRENKIEISEDKICNIIYCNKYNLGQQITHIAAQFTQAEINTTSWENSLYKPTPTIIEAAQALYQGHSVLEISRSDAGAVNLSITANAIDRIIENSKKNSLKSICFVTGVPGAGKTLAGLNIANERHRFQNEEHAVFLSGNGPLVSVLQEALARNDHEQSGYKISDARKKAKSFIQGIHNFMDDALSVITPPLEKVVVFDESQRAWTLAQTSSFMRKKKGLIAFQQSEPDFLISIMNRHINWATIICLVGGGQEINRGEAGLPAWFEALRTNYPNWKIYASKEIAQTEYTRGADFSHMVKGLNINYIPALHLSTSIRSFRSEHVSNFIKFLLENDIDSAAKIYTTISAKYPIVITRNLDKAKKWLRQHARGTERIGIIASSGATRLKPYGLCTQIKIDACNWFLNNKEDIRSSYYLEDIATEFDIQGLELDWTCVAWDANMRYDDKWIYKQFKGTRWLNVNSSESILYLKNSYRVLLTRARQGMVIFIPEGDSLDQTRLPKFYDGVFNLLTQQIGIINL